MKCQKCMNLGYINNKNFRFNIKDYKGLKLKPPYRSKGYKKVK